MKLGFVIPARDEEHSIGDVVSRCFAAGSRLAECRVIVSDNGSRDRTGASALAAGAEVVHEPRTGYGAACLAAIHHLGQWPDILVFLDGDGSCRPEEISSLLACLEDGAVDVVLGSRSSTKHMTLPQRWGTRLAVRLINWRWRCNYRDMGPFRCIRRGALEVLGMRDLTWGWTVEMQILAVQKGLCWKEIPVSWDRRTAGFSKIGGTIRGVIKAGTKILLTLGRYAFIPSSSLSREGRPRWR